MPSSNVTRPRTRTGNRRMGLLPLAAVAGGTSIQAPLVTTVTLPYTRGLVCQPASTVAVEPWSSRVRRSEEVQAAQGAGQVQQPLEQVGPPFVAHTQATKAKQPGERALHHPTVPAYAEVSAVG